MVFAAAWASSAFAITAPNWSSTAYRSGNLFYNAGYAPAQFYPNGVSPQLGAAKGNCTWYAHGRVRELGYTGTALNALSGNAGTWGASAAGRFAVDMAPRVGDVAESSGHVAVVEQVNANGTILVSESSYYVNTTNLTGDFLYATRTVTTGTFLRYIHVFPSTPPPPSEVAKYARHIVQLKGDKKKQKTAWYVSADLRRLWIPDAATLNALRSTGAPKPDALAADELDALPDQKNFWAAAGSAMTKQRTLRREMALRSANGKYAFTLRSDGNLALTGPGSSAIWDAKVSGIDYLVFQKDGNLAGYKDGVAAAVWSSHTAGKDARRFVVRNDGVAAVPDVNGKWLWSTKPETGTGPIAFVRNNDIWTMKADGSDARRLTTSPQVESAPAWSPDGRSIAFVRDVPGYPINACGNEVWLMNKDGSNQRRVPFVLGPDVMPGTTHEETMYSVDTLTWAPSGKDICVAASANSGYPSMAEGLFALQLYLVNPEGTAQRRLGPLQYGMATYSMSWRPDGAQIALTQGSRYYGRLVVYDVGQDKYTEPYGWRRYMCNAAWSPDGTRLAAMVLDDDDDWKSQGRAGMPGGLPKHLVVIDQRTNTEITITVPHPYVSEYLHPTWSPDGLHIACSYGSDRSWDNPDPPSTLLLSADGTSYSLLMSDADSPAWSPSAP